MQSGTPKLVRTTCQRLGAYLLKPVRRQFSNRSRQEHQDAHLIFQIVNTVGLDDYGRLREAALRHEQVMKIDLHMVHARRELK